MTLTVLINYISINKDFNIEVEFVLAEIKSKFEIKAPGFKL